MIFQRRDMATIGIDHRGNVAGGFNHQSVDWQLRQQRRMQDNHTRQVQDTFESAPYLPIPRNKNHIYWKELEEVLPQKIKLAKELQMLLKPVNTYNSWNHKTKIYGTSKCLDNPLNIIKNAYNMKADTTKYWSNRTYYSRLYQSLKNAQIPHHDILSIWGNPYIGVLTEWSDLSYQRRQRLVQEHPGIDETAEKIRREREEFRRSLEKMMNSPVDRFIDQMVIPMTTLALSNTPYGRAYAVAKTVVVPRLGQIATAMGVSELYRQYINFSKKHTNGGLKNSLGESAKPRVQATRTDADKYLQGLKDKGVLGQKGITKDGHEYYQFIKKCEYKGVRFKKGEYISRDTRHHEWEYFMNPKRHNGAIDPIKGDVYKHPDARKSLKLP